MSMVERKQRRYLGSSDRARRQLNNDHQIVVKAQLYGPAERRHRQRSRWAEYEPQSFRSEHGSRRRDAADADVIPRVITEVVVVGVVVGDGGGGK